MQGTRISQNHLVEVYSTTNCLRLITPNLYSKILIFFLLTFLRLTDNKKKVLEMRSKMFFWERHEKCVTEAFEIIESLLIDKKIVVENSNKSSWSFIWSDAIDRISRLLINFFSKNKIIKISTVLMIKKSLNIIIKNVLVSELKSEVVYQIFITLYEEITTENIILVNKNSQNCLIYFSSSSGFYCYWNYYRHYC